MKSRFTLLLIVFISPMFLLGQPDPSYAKQQALRTVSKKLKDDPTNFELQWRHLELATYLLNDIKYRRPFLFELGDMDEGFDKLNWRDKQFFKKEFARAYKKVILEKDTSVIGESDYYLLRMDYYGITRQSEKAILDARYLIDSAAYSNNNFDPSFYREHALESLFKIYVNTGNFNLALSTIDRFYEEKFKNKKIITRSDECLLHKHLLFEHFNKKESPFPYLKEICRNNFKIYFFYCKKFADEGLTMDDIEAGNKGITSNGQKPLYFSHSPYRKEHLYLNSHKTNIGLLRMQCMNVFEKSMYYTKNPHDGIRTESFQTAYYRLVMYFDRRDSIDLVHNDKVDSKVAAKGIRAYYLKEFVDTFYPESDEGEKAEVFGLLELCRACESKDSDSY